MNIVIAGKNNIAIEVAEYIQKKIQNIKLYSIYNKNDLEVDSFQRSFKKYCKNNKIPEINLEEAALLSDSIFLSLEFDKIVDPTKFISKRLYNIHFSLLPKYKGMFTSAWPIINNEELSGVTLHEIDSGIDTGKIIDRKVIEIKRNETAKSLYLNYIEKGTLLVIKNIHKLISNNYKSYAQDCYISSYYDRYSINYSNLNIVLNKTAIEILKYINAMTFREYQLPIIFGEYVFGGKILETKSNEKPGTLIKNNSKYFIIATVDNDLLIYKDIFQEYIKSCETGDLEFIEDNYNEYLINEKNKNGWSPIIVAAYHGNISVVEKLISLGANINDTNYKGTSVFMYAKDYAISNDNITILEKMIKLGADVTIRDIHGLTVFDYLNIENPIELNIYESFK